MEISVFEYLPDEALKIRLKVFGEEQGFVDEVDDIDDVALHFLAYVDKKPVATCRVFLRDDRFILGRFAVLCDYRKKGVGRALLAKAEEIVISLGYGTLSLHSQLRAVEFYKKCGYNTFGELELEENYPHIWMIKELN